jgi:tRNA dimethylallyltransferase
MILMNMKNTKRIVVIVGPTAIGKTRLSIKLAKALNTEIISCDSRQFYKELVIGAAPPHPEELSKIKHHFIQHLSIEDDFNAGQFEIDAIEKINKLHKTKDTIIIVGGSGLYIDAICKGFDKMPKINTELRVQLRDEFIKKGLLWAQNTIKEVDPEFYASCDKKNPQRLLRALEVYRVSGKKFSSWKKETPKKRPFNIIKIGLNTDRKILYNRINDRVDEMLENGLLEEVQTLLPFEEKNALQTVGYKEIFSFYNNKCTLKQAVVNIKKNTRRFAKRQLTWFRKDENTEWFEPHQIKEIKTFIGVS